MFFYKYKSWKVIQKRLPLKWFRVKYHLAAFANFVSNSVKSHIYKIYSSIRLKVLCSTSKSWMKNDITVWLNFFLFLYTSLSCRRMWVSKGRSFELVDILYDWAAVTGALVFHFVILHFILVRIMMMMVIIILKETHVILKKKSSEGIVLREHSQHTVKVHRFLHTISE